ncbi:MAG: GNAT family N-acetyltransferase [Rickettsiales bacterium]|nr:GNAT family N-acetyltransferase [Rickettsiales bacterium]
MTIRVEKLGHFSGDDLDNLCHSTHAAIEDGIGFNWLAPPLREVLESYWKGVLLVPERQLFAGWLDGSLAATAQLVRPSKSKETSYFAVSLESHFVAPWARGHGLAKAVLQLAEREAAHQGFSVIRLNVRETQTAAIHLYEEMGYQCWGILPFHEFVGGRMVAGHYFYKKLEMTSNIE